MFKRISVFLLSLTFVLGLTGCSEEITVEQTNNELNIYMSDSDFLLKDALILYRIDNPDVKVNVICPETTNIEQKVDNIDKLSTQIMSGSGPDIFPVSDAYWDIEKMVQAGAFADLSPFFENDETFDESNYNMTVMDKGVWNNKRFIVPYTYSLPILYTSKGALKETGFNTDNTKNFLEFMEETQKVMDDKNQKRTVFRQSWAMQWFHYIMGIKYADFEEKTINLDSPELKLGFEWYKNNLKQDRGDRQLLDFFGAEAIRDGNALFEYPFVNQLSNGINVNYRLINTFDEAVLVPMRNINGGLSARILNSVGVASSSPNIQNAYNFIKVLLSDELYSMYVQDQTDISVNNNANKYPFNKYRKPQRVGTVDVNYVIPEMKEEDWNNYINYTKEVDDAYFRIANLNLMEHMQPYINDEKSYEECLEIAKEKMKIYISE